MNNKIGIIITTFFRDTLLYKSIESLVRFKSSDYTIIIVDQNPTQEKERYFSEFYYYGVPYNSGLSYARNYGVQKAKDLGCNYVVIGSDSFLMNESIKNIKLLIKNDLLNKDLIGFNLKTGCVCGWEAFLTLIPGKSFHLTFIDKTITTDSIIEIDNIVFKLWNCDIVRNFFIAKTEMLIAVPYNNDLKLCEHESSFWEWKKAGYKVAWCDLVSADKMINRPDEYSDLRKENFRNGQQKLKEIYKIKGWVSYSNFENAK